MGDGRGGPNLSGLTHVLLLLLAAPVDNNVTLKPLRQHWREVLIVWKYLVENERVDEVSSPSGSSISLADIAASINWTKSAFPTAIPIILDGSSSHKTIKSHQNSSLMAQSDNPPFYSFLTIFSEKM